MKYITKRSANATSATSAENEYKWPSKTTMSTSTSIFFGKNAQTAPITTITIGFASMWLLPMLIPIIRTPTKHNTNFIRGFITFSFVSKRRRIFPLISNILSMFKIPPRVYQTVKTSSSSISDSDL